jgi:hypothetical protein
MAYKPSYFDFGISNKEYQSDGSLELKDMHATFGDGVIDMSPERATSEFVYSEIFGARNKRSIDPPYFTGIEIRDKTTLAEEGGAEGLFAFGFTNPFKDDNVLPFAASFAIHFDQETPLEALEKANQKFSLDTHVDEYGVFVVGGYNGNNKYTASRSGDSSELQIESGSVTASEGELGKLILNGAKHIPGFQDPTDTKNFISTDVQVGELFDWLNPLDDNDQDEDKVETGYRLQVIIDNKESENGVVRNVDAFDIGNKDLMRTAERIFQSLQSQSAGGSMSIDMETSNKSVVPRIGDTMTVEGELDTCGELQQPAYDKGDYTVAGVEHRYDGSHTVDVQIDNPIAEEQNLQKKYRVLDVSSGNTYSFEEVYGYKPSSIEGING